jgi:hypothetical protein
MTKTRKQNFKDHPFIKKASAKAYSQNITNGIKKKPLWKRIQSGGGSIKVGDYIFLYDEEGESTYISYSKKGKICFFISFDLPSQEIGIDISYYSHCSYSKPLEKGTGTLSMLQAILQIIFSRSDINSYNRILITDNSSIDCVSFLDKSLREIKLIDMYYLCTGCTWYNSLAPMFLKKQYDEESYLEKRSHIIGDHSLSYDTFLERLNDPLRKVVESISDKYITFDTSKPGSASKFLNEIRKAKIHTSIFDDDFIDDFFEAFDAKSLHGKSWFIALHNGKIIAPETNICMKDTGYIFPKEKIQTVTNEDYQKIKSLLQVANQLFELIKV